MQWEISLTDSRRSGRSPESRRVSSLADLPRPPAHKTGWPWTEESALLPAVAPGGGSWPRMGIVTPSYNQALYLEEAIRSVLLQGYPDLEFIVMDGGSTDGSAAILDRYAPWLSFWQSRPDGGQSEAIDAGFRRSSGEILAWLNSDDRYRPGALGRVARFFIARPAVVFANGDVNLIDAEGTARTRLLAIRALPRVTADLELHAWPQQGCFWRRHAYEQVGGLDHSLTFCMDRDLFLRLVRRGPARRIPGPPLADFRVHDAMKSVRLPDVWRRERAQLVTRHGSPRRNSRSRRLLLLTVWYAMVAARWLRWRGIKLGLEL